MINCGRFRGRRWIGMAVCSSALQSTFTRLLPGYLDSLSHSFDAGLDSVTQHVAGHWEIEKE